MTSSLDASDRQWLCAWIRRHCSPRYPQSTGCPVSLRALDVEVVIFDVYGTMLVSAAGDVGPDSDSQDGRAFVAALQEVELPVTGSVGQGAAWLRQEIVAERRRRQLLGEPYPEVDILAVWERVLGRLHLTASRSQIARMALVYECLVNPVWPMPQLQRTLARLRAATITLGILSNAQFYTELLLETLLHGRLKGLGFDPGLCYWSFREGMGKPSPRLFGRLAAALAARGIAPSKVAYIGNDMCKDIVPAHDQGWNTVLFAGDCQSLRGWPQASRDTFQVKPDLVVSEMGQLPRCFI